MDKYMVGLCFMSNLCIPSRLGQFEVKLTELCKLQLGIYLEHHCRFFLGLTTPLECELEVIIASVISNLRNNDIVPFVIFLVVFIRVLEPLEV
jgi:hypothetical protein